MSLVKYQQKRNFKKTPEPKGRLLATTKHRFVVQEHHATRLHYDFRLELDGVLKSWAVPKGPSMEANVKRLAVMTEDHPVAYLKFKGNIPTGEYGAGKMKIWDQGLYFPVDEQSKKISDKQALKNIKKGELKIFLKGKKIQGGFVLIHWKNLGRNWLLMKHRDEYITEVSKASRKKSTVKKSIK